MKLFLIVRLTVGLKSSFKLMNLDEGSLELFAPEFYWSSTEKNVSEAWLIQFGTGELISSSKANTVGRIRAVAYF